MRAYLLPTIFALLTLSACSPAPSPPHQVHPCDETAIKPGLEVGTGEDCFQRLADGDKVILYAGPQGGDHIFLSIRCNTCKVDDVLHYGVKLLDKDEFVVAEPTEGLAQAGYLENVDGVRGLVGARAFMPADGSVVGKSFRLYGGNDAGMTDVRTVVVDHEESL